MTIKVNNEYLDFDGVIQVERSAKLIEAIDENTGDFSYTFRIQRTSHNIRIVRLYTINQTDKLVGAKIPAIIDSDGIAMYSGFIQIVGSGSDYIDCAFFSGNTNWFNEITGTLYDIDISEYDVQNTEANIVASWTSDSGVVFPVVDKGLLSKSLSNRMVKNDTLDFQYNDFQPFIYVKNLLSKIIQQNGLKIEGEILDDYRFSKLIMTSNPSRVSSERVERSTSKVGRLTAQSITTTPAILELSDADPFFDGSSNNWNNTTYRYTADVDMTLGIQLDFNFSVSQQYILEIYRDGILVKTVYIPKSGTVISINIFAGSYLEFFLSAQTSTANLRTNSSITITPTFFRTVYISDFMPEQTQLDFIKTIFQMFNVVTSFNNFTKTITTVLFKSIKDRPEIDISEYVSGYDIDYVRPVENFYKKNYLVYEQQDLKDVQVYNVSNPTPLGGGLIEVENEILPDSGNIVELQAIAPYSYFNESFQMWLMNLNFLDISRAEDREITSVTDNGGIARINYTGSGLGVSVGSVVEIFDTDNDNYEGIGIISSLNSIGSKWIEIEGLNFIDDVTGFFAIMSYEGIDTTLPIFALHSPSLDVNKFSSLDSFFINGTEYTSASYAYFYKPRLQLDIDSEIFSLSFGRGTDPEDYQIPLIESYYSDLVTILNDAQLVTVDWNIPFRTFITMDFLNPIRVIHKDFNSKFYLNKISGYEEKSKTSQGELIKLI